MACPRGRAGQRHVGRGRDGALRPREEGKIMAGSRRMADQAPGPDPSWRPLYRAGAVAAGLAVILYVVALVVFVVTTAPPTAGGAAMLAYVDAHRSIYI